MSHNYIRKRRASESPPRNAKPKVDFSCHPILNTAWDSFKSRIGFSRLAYTTHDAYQIIRDGTIKPRQQPGVNISAIILEPLVTDSTQGGPYAFTFDVNTILDQSACQFYYFSDDSDPHTTRIIVTHGDEGGGLIDGIRYPPSAKGPWHVSNGCHDVVTFTENETEYHRVEFLCTFEIKVESEEFQLRHHTKCRMTPCPIPHSSSDDLLLRCEDESWIQAILRAGPLPKMILETEGRIKDKFARILNETLDDAEKVSIKRWMRLINDFKTKKDLYIVPTMDERTEEDLAVSLM